MSKEEAVFNRLTLSSFKRWNSTALKSFNNYTIVMANSSEKMRIS